MTRRDSVRHKYLKMNLIFWVTILSVCFCGGCLLAFLGAAIRAPQYARSAAFGGLSAIYAIVFWQLWVFGDARLLMLLLLLAAILFGLMLVRRTQFPPQGRLQKSIVTFSIVMGF